MIVVQTWRAGAIGVTRTEGGGRGVGRVKLPSRVVTASTCRGTVVRVLRHNIPPLWNLTTIIHRFYCQETQPGDRWLVEKWTGPRHSFCRCNASFVGIQSIICTLLSRGNYTHLGLIRESTCRSVIPRTSSLVVMRVEPRPFVI